MSEWHVLIGWRAMSEWRMMSEWDVVREWQEMFSAQRYSEVYLADSNPDFAKLAEAYGIDGYNIFDRQTAAEIVPEVLAKGKPAVMNFVVYESEKVFPMVPMGAGVDEMIIGDQEPDEVQVEGKKVKT